MEMGAAGLKIHEDAASFTSVIDNALTIADQYRRAGLRHSTPTPTRRAASWRTPSPPSTAGRSTPTIEGLGGRHPNVLELAGVPHVLGLSTRTWRRWPGAAAAAPWPRSACCTTAGAIAMMSSDSQGMGRIGEVSIRTWQLAHRMKEAFGAEGRNDNARILRYLAKLTVNAAIAQGMAHEIGSLRSGLLADIVLWRPEFFGVKPQLVLKNGFVVWGPVGGGNDSTRLGQPQIYRPMFGSYGLAPASLGVAFVGQAAIDSGLAGHLKIRRRLSAVQNSRNLTKADLGSTPRARRCASRRTRWRWRSTASRWTCPRPRSFR